MTHIFERLGIRPVINGAATLTRLGGSLMPPVVWEAMRQAGQYYADITEVQRAVGRRIAELTHNEAAYVCAGAAAGLTLATAACITGTDPEKIARLPELAPTKEVIVHRSQRNGYDYAIRQVGVRLVEIGAATGTTPADLEAALSDRTAAVFYFAGAHFAQGALPLETVIAIAHRAGVPVIVDAAAQIPPASNLWRFTQQGADLAIFSGGKGLCGPQSTGLIVGRADLIAAVARNGNPYHAIGRPMKVSKEEMVGLLAAIEWYLSQDEAALLERYEAVVQTILLAFREVPGVRAERAWPSEAGQPHARALLIFDAARLGLSRDAILEALRNGTPAIELAPAGSDGLYINPQTLQPGEEQIIIARLRAILAGQA